MSDENRNTTPEALTVYLPCKEVPTRQDAGAVVEPLVYVPEHGKGV